MGILETFKAPTALEGLKMAYERDETDEFVLPTLIEVPEKEAGLVRDGDSIVFMNYRPDRARQITRAFVDGDKFEGFERMLKPALAKYVCLTEYDETIEAPVAYASLDVPNCLGEYLETLEKTQLRIAETEKYAHVSFFFSGGRELAFKGETRVLIPSPKVATYDLTPEMSAPAITDKLVDVIEKQEYDVIICNYANTDMVGHTGVFDAAVKAVECIDTCLERVVSALMKVGGECLITADHGNIEKMKDAESGQPHTAHTTAMVPLVYVTAREAKVIATGESSLADIAPTMLHMMDLAQPKEFEGKSLVEFL
jgi:2,3-bisphosphoglycerate-independent phosphoglycerate mutase